MKSNFLLQDVIDDLVNVNASLTAPLIKLQYFGLLTKNKELIDFTQKEIIGYELDDNFPLHRKKFGSITAHVQDNYGQKDLNLPIEFIDEEHREFFRFTFVKEGIKILETWAKEIEKGHRQPSIEYNYPLTLRTPIQDGINKYYVRKPTVISFRIGVNAICILEILELIRIELLSRVMKIGESFGYDIELESFKKDLSANNQTINNFFHEITGHGNVLNTGSNSELNIKALINSENSNKL